MSVLASPPSQYWVATDLGKLITAHNLRFTGSISSMAAPMAATNSELLARYLSGDIDYLPYVRNESADTAVGVAPFQLTVINDYSVEVLLETVRRRINPLLPSRLSAVFAFANRKNAVWAARRAGRPVSEVFEFTLVESPLTRVARANFEIVSLLRSVIYAAMWTPTQLEGIAEAYWNAVDSLEVEVPSAIPAGSFRTVSARPVGSTSSRGD